MCKKKLNAKVITDVKNFQINVGWVEQSETQQNWLNVNWFEQGETQ
jgi:hypothetical protein